MSQVLANTIRDHGIKTTLQVLIELLDQSIDNNDNVSHLTTLQNRLILALNEYEGKYSDL